MKRTEDYGERVGWQCPECRQPMVIAHAGSSSTLYVCPCCGISQVEPPPTGKVPPPRVPMQKS